MKKFEAYVVREKDNIFKGDIEEAERSFLPDNEVLIEVLYSGLNYKDALSATGNRGVTRGYPHIPGIDASGMVVEDTSGTYKPGQQVIVTSYDLGMNTPGGFGRYISVPSEWIVPLPEGLSLEESMMLGTAGLTAGMGIYKMLVNGQKPSMGRILVTGASGGVGCMSVAILSAEGFKVLASTGKKDSTEFLKEIGADDVISRQEVDDTSGKPLLRPAWAGAIDNVGGNTLGTALKACKKDGNVISIGMVGSPSVETTVFPFILNGVNLMGIDSATCKMDLRLEVWNKLAFEWKPTKLESMCKTVRITELEEYIPAILKGQVRGRIIIKH